MRYPDYYGLLGLDPDHDPDELREAFLARWGEADGSLRGERVFLRHLGASSRRRDLLREAYTVLSDPRLLSAYRRGAGIAAPWGPTRPDKRGGMLSFREGCRRLVHRDYDGAYACFRKAIDRSPGVATFVNYAVFSLMVSGQRREQARGHLKDSLALDGQRAETVLLEAWMQARSGARHLAAKSMLKAGRLPVSDVPLFLRLKQVPDLGLRSGDGILRRMIVEARNAFGTSIRISTR